MNLKTKKRKNQVVINNSVINVVSDEELNQRIDSINTEMKAATWRDLKINRKFGKNEKLSFISDDTLIVGCDIGSETHYIRAIDSRGCELSREAFSFSNTAEGFQAAKEWVINIAARHNKKQIVLGIEPTGHYWFCIASWMIANGISVVKKERGINLDKLTNREKVFLIDALRKKYKLKDLLPVLKLSKSSYCYQVQCIKSEDKYKDLRLKIKDIFAKNKARYGYRRIHCSLKKYGIIVSEKIVRRIMIEEHLTVKISKRRKYNSYKGEIGPEVENLINRDFSASKPNEKWLTDITEFHIPAGKVYLSPIIDCFDGMVVSWTIGTSPNAELANSMLRDAIDTLKSTEHPLIHSDRGCHYRWPEWLGLVDRASLTRSMSKKGCSPDNSACEGFFGRLKNEMFYNRNWNHISIDSFISELDEYMHWYNQDRIKMVLGGMSPLQYRRSLGIET